MFIQFWDLFLSTHTLKFDTQVKLSTTTGLIFDASFATRVHVYRKGNSAWCITWLTWRQWLICHHVDETEKKTMKFTEKTGVWYLYFKSQAGKQMNKVFEYAMHAVNISMWRHVRAIFISILLLRNGWFGVKYAVTLYVTKLTVCSFLCVYGDKQIFNAFTLIVMSLFFTMK